MSLTLTHSLTHYLLPSPNTLPSHLSVFVENVEWSQLVPEVSWWMDDVCSAATATFLYGW